MVIRLLDIDDEGDPEFACNMVVPAANPVNNPPGDEMVPVLVLVEVQAALNPLPSVVRQLSDVPSEYPH